jgi:hypothetical protein
VTHVQLVDQWLLVEASHRVISNPNQAVEARGFLSILALGNKLVYCGMLRLMM